MTLLIFAAFFAVLGSYYCGSWAAGLAFAIVFGVILGLLYYVLVIRFHSDEFIIGVALNIFAGGLTTFLLRTIFQVKGSSISIHDHFLTKKGDGITFKSLMSL